MLLSFSCLCAAILFLGILAGLYDRLLRRRFLAKYSDHVRSSLSSYTGKSAGSKSRAVEAEMRKEVEKDIQTTNNEFEPVSDIVNGKPKPYRQFSSISTISGKAGE